MGKFIALPGLVFAVALAAFGLASSRFIDDGAVGATALTLAGALFTVALAAYIGDPTTGRSARGRRIFLWRRRSKLL